MMESSFIFGLGIGLAAVFASLGSILILAALQARRKPARHSIFDERQKGTLFLFDGETLIDCTPGAQAILAASPVPGSAWAKLLAYLATTFPEIAQQLSKLPETGMLSLASNGLNGPALVVRAEHRGGLSRIALTDGEAGEGAPGQDPLAQRCMTEELTFLQSMMSRAPFLAWREQKDGDIIWANTAYLLRAADFLPPGKDLSWPLPRLFEKTATQQGASGQRQRLRLPNGGGLWFDLVSMPEGEGWRVYALPADSAVQAETTLRDFMQILTKTFAHLPIGLAIFDNRRRLQLFNPALIDLTGLAPDFLSMRPSLLAVLDALRDHNMVPEPKDYRDWRKQITDLERATASGVYQETWNLPGGQTYKVIGRPHPNGALALMIEDISSEITRTRRYRADLELGQSVIDSMPDAMAVFSETGILVMTNAAYAKLWGHDPASTLTNEGIRSLAHHWRSKTAPNGVWAEAEEYVCTIGDRQIWSDEVRMADGRLIVCTFTPLSGGATLVGFRVQQGTADTPSRSSAARRSA